jgi:hypothetical protein
MTVPHRINQLWYWISRSEGLRFQQAVRDVGAVQSRMLLDILKRNRSSEYGKKFGFDRVKDIDDYRNYVPVVRYDDLATYIDRIISGEKNLLTAETVERLVPTSGSSGGMKLIPYTASLKQDFRKAIAAWIWTTFRFNPKAMQGRAYWSITPMASIPQHYQGFVPIGFESDSEYLGVWSRWLAEQLLLPPAQVSSIRNVENARYANLLYMLASADLALVSVWSPTFLLSLLNQVEPWIDSICRDIADGIVHLPHSEVVEPSKKLRLRANQKRAEELKRIRLESRVPADFIRRCWPNLSLLSCWGDGNSAHYFAKLKTLFPHVPMQPKGLLATECVVSFPGNKNGHSLLAVRSHFFEFAPVNATGQADYRRPLLAEELTLGNRYRVVVTTNGGLYRYDMGDVVEVIGFEERCPIIRFVGRMDAVSDLVGEKLNEEHVRSTLKALFCELGLEQELFLLVVRESSKSGYTLLLSADTNLRREDRTRVAEILDERLRSNPQYDLARKLEQLVQVGIEILPLEGRELWSRYEVWQNGNGKRVGELKANVLDYRGTWREFLSKELSV